MSTDEPYILDEQIGFVLRKASQRHTAIFARLIDCGLTPPQFAALVRLRERGEMSQNALGRAIAIDAATIKGISGRLQDRGLVETRRDDGDKRRILLRLTGEGRALIETAIINGRKISSQTMAPLNPSEQRRLLALLEKIS